MHQFGRIATDYILFFLCRLLYIRLNAALHIHLFLVQSLEDLAVYLVLRCYIYPSSGLRYQSFFLLTQQRISSERGSRNHSCPSTPILVPDMSIFSKIIGASKAAKAHKKAQTPDPVAPSATPAPYRHVPTHAAIDAMSGAPSSWKEVDRFAIKAQHKRRSQMPKTNSSTSLHGNHSFGFNNNHTSYHGSEYGLMPGRVEARRSGTGYNPYQPSPLSSHGRLLIKNSSMSSLLTLNLGATPAISEVNSTSSSTSGTSSQQYPFIAFV